MAVDADSSRAIRASTWFGLRQWLLYVDSGGVTVWRYGILELLAYMSHRLIGVPSDPRPSIDSTAGNEFGPGHRANRYSAADLIEVSVLNRGSHAIQIRTRETVRLWWIHDRHLGRARECLAQLFPEIYRESGYGRLRRAFSKRGRPGV